MMKIFVRLTRTLYFSHLPLTSYKFEVENELENYVERFSRNWIDGKRNYFRFIQKLWIMFGLVLFFRLINHLHHRSDSFESPFIFNARTRKYNKHRKKISFKQIFTVARKDSSHEFKFKRIIGMSVNNELEIFRKCKLVKCRWVRSILYINNEIIFYFPKYTR